ncbi:MAG: fructose-1,6-bisphosphatase [Rikenellaceae bacterium]
MFTDCTQELNSKQLHYLSLLSDKFPNIADTSREIINLEAILNLPKGTEHFLTDVHGEYEAFQHVLKNASGAVRRKVDDVFGNTISLTEKKDLCTLIYYPERKMDLIKVHEVSFGDWCVVTLNRLVTLCQNVSSKYTRSKVRKALPEEFSYIIQELLHESTTDRNKYAYVDVIIRTIISTGRAEAFIIAICNLIQRLIIDSLHIIGDIYDRGPGAHIIMDTLCDYHNLDIQWGNHDILWMGATAGNDCCMVNVIRMVMRYRNLATLEDGYGISLVPLTMFAMDVYGDDPCEIFAPRSVAEDVLYNQRTLQLIAKMHKAITIIQFKLEAQMVERRPEFDATDRKVLENIDFEKGVYIYEGKEYALKDTNFPTIDPENPYVLTEEERELVDKLHASFARSEKLQKHVDCLYKLGSLYLVINNNLLFHASIPLNEDGSFKSVEILGEYFSGRAFMDRVDKIARDAFFNRDNATVRAFSVDYMWYLWCGKNSPLFDKERMATFESYFLADKKMSHEAKGHYYNLRDREDVCIKILEEFGIKDKQHSHIINGHVPVKAASGETPVKANGRLLVIDGGFSRAYQTHTGIAGYTLVYHSRGLELVQHEPFSSTQKAIEEGHDIVSRSVIVEHNMRRVMVRDTDKGLMLMEQVSELLCLLRAYRSGLIKERASR